MRQLTLAAVLGLLVGPTWVLAQQPGTQGNITTVGYRTTFEPMVADDDLRHGLRVRIIMSDEQDAPMEGTIVRVDPGTDRLFVRTHPGAAPIAVVRGDIEKIEKGIRYPVSNEGIRLAGVETVDVVQDEIQAIEVVNGGKRTVIYSAAALSPSERAHLQSLEAAENELARISYLADRELQVLDNAIAIQTQQRKAQALLNQHLAKQPSLASDMAAFGPWPGFSAFSLPAYSFGYNAPLPPTQIVAPKLAVSSDALTTARQRLAAAQNRAVFERGRLVAVIIDDAE